MVHKQPHRMHRTGWLRASVLGANDGIVSTSSLVLGVAAAGVSKESIILAGIASLVAGAMSMAAGEYISVSAQSDIEQADLVMEAQSLRDHPDLEEQELSRIYQQRGLTPSLARQVAQQLTQHDALAAHARDDIGITEHLQANPLQAACFSGVSFTLGALLPLLTVWFMAVPYLLMVTAIASLIFLSILGGIAAYVGGAPMMKSIIRVAFWGTAAMLITVLTGIFFGTMLL